ncbi:MAG: hypothetical protein ABI960_04240 [Candidatus Eisenbacteria bacterium]
MDRGDFGGIMALMALLPIIFAIALLPAIFYLLTLQKALNRCSPESRTMTPGLVWLSLIPVFNIVWVFFVVNALSESLHREFTRRGMVEEPQPGRSLGLAYAILSILGIIPLVGILAAIGALVCWILYWIKIAEYSRKLEIPWSAPVAVNPAGV